MRDWTPLRKSYSRGHPAGKPSNPPPSSDAPSEIQPLSYNVQAQPSRAERTRAYSSRSAQQAPPLPAVIAALPNTQQQTNIPPPIMQNPPPIVQPQPPSPQTISRKQRLKRLQYSRNVAITFLAIISVAFITLFVLALNNDDWEFEDMNINPWFGPSSQALLSVGAQDLNLVETGQWWRLLSSPFINAGIIQIVTNLIGLWTYGYFAVTVLPFPALSVPIVYLVSCICGSIASANLDAYYVVCGAFGGIAAMIGVSWADNIVNPRPHVHQRIASFAALTLVTACYVAVSLLPMVDVWYTSAALLAGFFASIILLLLPKVGKGAKNNSAWLSLQVISVLVLMGGLTTGIVGISLNTKVGETSSFLVDGSCLQVDWWFCVKQTNTTAGCTYTPGSDGQNTLQCPNGVKIQLSGIDATNPDDPSIVSTLCYEYCGIDPTAPDAFGGGNTGNTTTLPTAPVAQAPLPASVPVSPSPSPVGGGGNTVPSNIPGLGNLPISGVNIPGIGNVVVTNPTNPVGGGGSSSIPSTTLPDDISSASGGGQSSPLTQLKSVYGGRKLKFF